LTAHRIKPVGFREETLVSAFNTAYDAPALRGDASAPDRARALLGQVMGYVAITVGFTALGAYLGRDLSGGLGLVLFIAGLGAVIALNVARRRGDTPDEASAAAGRYMADVKNVVVSSA
jgi:hypothetical protein